MNKLNLSLELKALVEDVGNLINTLSAIGTNAAKGIETIPETSAQLAHVTGEIESYEHRLMDVLDRLIESDKNSAELLVKLEEIIPSNAESKGIIEQLTGSIDKNQHEHMQMLETMQFQDLTSQQISYASSLLCRVEKELNYILNIFSDTWQSERNRANANVLPNVSASFSDKQEAPKEADQAVESYK